MKITKYSSQNCIKCKMLDKILNHLNIENIENVMLEDVGIDFLAEKGIQSFPTLIFENNGVEKRLSGTFLPQDIIDIINSFS